MSQNNKRLAKNTAFMYFRMIFLMLISLYTSRIVLKQLGVADYGVYNVVGSVVAMFTSLRSIFASSTQRFLNYEIGRGKLDKLNLVFNLSIRVNLLISIIFVISVEILGYWFLNYKINIDPSRLYAATIVFHLSVISSVITLITTTFDALIISHEKMAFYAYLSIFEGVMRFVVALSLTYVTFDKLIVFGFLHLAIVLIVVIISNIYCYRHFEECRYSMVWDKGYFSKMTKFAGWNFMGNTAFTVTQNGLNMVLNMFGGPIVNAARGISYQVQTALKQFLVNVNVVVTPYTIKKWAAGDHSAAFRMMYFSSKVLFMVQFCMVVPLTYLTWYILDFWLGQVPEYSVVFMQLILFNSLIRSTHAPLDTIFKANGQLKEYQISESIILFLPLPVAYVLLKEELPYYSVFMAVVFFEIVNYSVILLLCSNIAKLPLTDYLKCVIIPCCVCILFALTFFIILNSYIINLAFMLATTLFVILTAFIFMFFVGFSRYERNQILDLIK